MAHLQKDLLYCYTLGLKNEVPGQAPRIGLLPRRADDQSRDFEPDLTKLVVSGGGGLGAARG